MAVIGLLVQTYTTNVYLTGRNSLSNILAKQGQEYVDAVEQRAADNYFIDDIDHALAAAWITQQEHAETLALKGPEDPQYRPAVFAAATPATE